MKTDYEAEMKRETESQTAAQLNADIDLGMVDVTEGRLMEFDSPEHY